MATAKTARLIASLELNADKFAKGVKVANSQIDRLAAKTGKIGGLAKTGVSNAIGNIARVGAVAAVGIGAAVKTGLDDLAELESAVTSVDGAIAQLGLTGKVTGSQIAGWANEIESDIGAAFDDKEITAATATLIRFGKVTPENIRPAMEIIADLAVKTGDVDSAASLLAKALADPTKAAGKLARQGIILTKAQQKQIEAFVEAGDAASAQNVILEELSRTTQGAALASQGPYAQALAKLADVSEDARKALATGFLPVITKVADLLSKELAKPATMSAIKAFGDDLAKGLDSLIEIARNLPWKTIGDSLKLAGSGAKAVLGAFTAMPPWVQTAVLTSWGLNKLTGGALGGIVAELGKGLIKGVLGMTAGVVNLKAGVVNGGIGSGGGGGQTTVVPGGKQGKLANLGSTIMKVAIVSIAVEAAAMLAQELAAQSTAIDKQGKDVINLAKTNAPKMNERELVNAIQNIDDQLKSPLNAAALIITEPLNHGLSNLDTTQKELKQQLVLLRAGTAINAAATNTTQDKSKAAIIEEQRRTKTATTGGLDDMRAEAVAARREAATGVGRTTSTVDRARAGVVSATAQGAGTVASAIRANRPIVTTNVTVNVTAAKVTSSQTIQARYGAGGGSAQQQAREFG